MHGKAVKNPAQADYAKMAVDEIVADIRERRNRKLALVIASHLPAWIIQERVNTAEHTCIFDVVFRPEGVWQQRRYTFEAEVDVLHFRGAEPFDENKLDQLPKDMLYSPPQEIVD